MTNDAMTKEFPITNELLRQLNEPTGRTPALNGLWSLDNGISLGLGHSLVIASLDIGHSIP